MSMQFNRHGDLFATDQEGATWLPNGNPLDELLHLQPGRHYGFPPRHPKYLPDVIDEPSVFDYAPQHQSLCGFRFNDGGEGRAVFGPARWRGDALLAGFTRGEFYPEPGPCSTAIRVSGFAFEDLLIEIEALAVCRD